MVFKHLTPPNFRNNPGGLNLSALSHLEWNKEKLEKNSEGGGGASDRDAHPSPYSVVLPNQLFKKSLFGTAERTERTIW